MSIKWRELVFADCRELTAESSPKTTRRRGPKNPASGLFVSFRSSSQSRLGKTAAVRRPSLQRLVAAVARSGAVRSTRSGAAGFASRSAARRSFVAAISLVAVAQTLEPAHQAVLAGSAAADGSAASGGSRSAAGRSGRSAALRSARSSAHRITSGVARSSAHRIAGRSARSSAARIARSRAARSNVTACRRRSATAVTTTMVPEQTGVSDVGANGDEQGGKQIGQFHLESPQLLPGG